MRQRFTGEVGNFPISSLFGMSFAKSVYLSRSYFINKGTGAFLTYHILLSPGEAIDDCSCLQLPTRHCSVVYVSSGRRHARGKKQSRTDRRVVDCCCAERHRKTDSKRVRRRRRKVAAAQQETDDVLH